MEFAVESGSGSGSTLNPELCGGVAGSMEGSWHRDNAALVVPCADGLHGVPFWQSSRNAGTRSETSVRQGAHRIRIVVLVLLLLLRRCHICTCPHLSSRNNGPRSRRWGPEGALAKLRPAAWIVPAAGALDFFFFARARGRSAQTRTASSSGAALWVRIFRICGGESQEVNGG